MKTREWEIWNKAGKSWSAAELSRVNEKLKEPEESEEGKASISFSATRFIPQSYHSAYEQVSLPLELPLSSRSHERANSHNRMSSHERANSLDKEDRLTRNTRNNSLTQNNAWNKNSEQQIKHYSYQDILADTFAGSDLAVSNHMVRELSLVKYASAKRPCLDSFQPAGKPSGGRVLLGPNTELAQSNLQRVNHIHHLMQDKESDQEQQSSDNKDNKNSKNVFADASRLKALLDSSPQVWRGGSVQSRTTGQTTGYPKLDSILPTQGWPDKSLIEVLSPNWGIGELQLLLPKMRELTQQQKWVIWISPPYQPYAPALLSAGVDINYVIVINPETSCKDAFWSMEKALQTQACAMVLAWMNWLPNGVIRRLQLASEKGGGMAFLFREREAKNSPAALRLQLQATRTGVRVKVLKARGSSRQHSVDLCLSGSAFFEPSVSE